MNPVELYSMYLTSINPTWVNHTRSSIDSCPQSSRSECPVIPFSTSQSPSQHSCNVHVLEQEDVMLSWGRNPENHCDVEESYIALAVDILRVQDRESIQALKDFLTVLPNPRFIENVLIVAIYQLAEIDSEACRWILRHSSYLMPELDVKSYALQWVYLKLRTQGLKFNQDFQFGETPALQLTEQAQLALSHNLCMGDRLILQEILSLHIV
ncbi:MAG: hypothetical protein ACKPEN_16675 [Planktothrix sp.]|uniref:hypothetical protein n=1 Tax=Planktothrix sp. TaxID=3088171 RepID=UPI0038D49E9D